MTSQSAIRKKIYEEIVHVSQPGDICFFITENIKLYNEFSEFEKKFRKWMGFVENDISIWHVGVLSKFEKKPKSSQIRPYIIHSTKEKGVFEQHITPEYFSSKNISDDGHLCRTILEITRFKDIKSENCKKMVRYCKDQIGRSFPKNIRTDSLTYLLGLPNFLSNKASFSCHSLVYAAFQHIGIQFPHRLEAAPFFNIGRHLGHPLFQSGPNLRNNHFYLRDHHLYQDPRLTPIVSITYDQCDNNIILTRNPQKYSWNSELQDVYANYLVKEYST